jgi:predicted RNA binding protein YcfA (HicA-like mRNA interferase family)
MPKLPALTDKQVIKKLRKAGFRFYRSAKGSHEMWVRDIDGKIAVGHAIRAKLSSEKPLKTLLMLPDFQ